MVGGGLCYLYFHESEVGQIYLGRRLPVMNRRF